MNKTLNLGVSQLTKRVYVGEISHGLFTGSKQDITDDFKRGIVNYCSESVDFEIDGMKFRATCERID